MGFERGDASLHQCYSKGQARLRPHLEFWTKRTKVWICKVSFGEVVGQSAFNNHKNRIKIPIQAAEMSVYLKKQKKNVAFLDLLLPLAGPCCRSADDDSEAFQPISRHLADLHPLKRTSSYDPGLLHPTNCDGISSSINQKRRKFRKEKAFFSFTAFVRRKSDKNLVDFFKILKMISQTDEQSVIKGINKKGPCINQLFNQSINQPIDRKVVHYRFFILVIKKIMRSLLFHL
jgi:hypothetical protein